MEKYMKALDKKKILQPGTIVRRVGGGKDQQGALLEYDGDNNMVLVNILDWTTGTLLAIKGVLKPMKDDRLYYCDTPFDGSPDAKKALKIVSEWSLYKKHASLQKQIINFISIAFIPEQIIELEKKEQLPFLFVPIQERFRIGRFSERRNPERVCNEAFILWLESLQRGNHITYLALVMQQKHHVPRFYSAGTRPHEETHKLLLEEDYNFHPTHGGHLKAVGIEDGKKHFIVDAGSTYLGRGVKTPLHMSQAVAAALKKVYPEFEFTPMEGRGAFGTEQSY
jgi:hypothetical protein